MKRSFISLDRHGACLGDYDEPDRYREIEAIADGPMIAQGAGLSYVAASFGAGVATIGMRRFDRILAFDADERWIEVEAGTTLGQIYAFLAARGLALPVQPGHPQITVGGCIAGNVHGKNQVREGLFGEHVQELRLFHPKFGVLRLSRTIEPEIFDLTVGGLGLTGIIQSARLSVVALTSPVLEIEHVAVASLEDAFDRVPRLAAESEMAYGWIDLADPDRHTRGFIAVARASAERGAAPAPPRFRRLDPAARRWRPRLFTAATLPLINRLYHHLETRRGGRRRMPLFNFLYPAVGRERYFDGFGRDGFIEVQSLVPEVSARDYAREVVSLLRRRRGLVALATVKAFRGEKHLLHYNGTGISFTVDIANGPAGVALAAELDALNCASGAITAVLKDSRLGARVAERQYPDYGLMRQRLRAFDGARQFASILSRRLELQEGA
jgi:decaprenylphospho-beta-D-ribofuranose 2-oxidase